MAHGLLTRVSSRSPALTAALIASATIALATLYAGTMAGLVTEWMASPDASYGIILLAVSLLIAWRRRRMFVQAANAAARAHAGFVVLLIGLCLYLAGLLGADLFLSRISFIAVLAGGLWFVAGARAVRIMAVPLLFLLIAIPLPALVVNTITLPLQLAASHIAESSLAAVGVPVFRDGNVLTLPSTTLEVAEACSGLRSLVSLGAIGIVLAWATDGSSWRRGSLVLLTVPIAILMNGLRIAATGIACETWGPQIASGGWHSFTGWITFVASMFVLMQLRNALAWVSAARGWSPTVAET